MTAAPKNPMLGLVGPVVFAAGLCSPPAGARPPVAEGAGPAVSIADPPPVFFAGQTIFPALRVDVRDVDRVDPASAAFFKITSTAGAENSGKLYGAFAAAVLAHVVVKSGGAGGVGFNDDCDLDGPLANSRTVGCTAAEFDVNNGDGDRRGPVFGSANFTVGMLVDGGGLHTNNAGVDIANGNTRMGSGLPPPFVLWDAGLRIEQLQPENGFVGYHFGIQDLSNSAVAVDIRGTHGFGLNLASARFVGADGDPAKAFSINAPGFRVDGTGRTIAGHVDAETVAASAALVLPHAAPPRLNASCRGAEGSMVAAPGFLYVCDPATGTYGRVGIAH